MSKMKSACRPPLAKSPPRLRPRRILRSSTASNSIQTPPGSLAKSLKPNRSWATNDQELRPEYLTISSDLRALAEDVRTELGKGESENAGVVYPPSSSMVTSIFERGRFYEEYAALRNEWLKRKKGQLPAAKTGYNLGVIVESVKRSSSRKLGSLRKSSSAYSLETPRYMLRSMSKENKKPPLPLKWDKALPGEETKIVLEGSEKLKIRLN